MDIATKYKIISEIINSSDDHVLNEVKSLLKIKDELDFWDRLNTADQAAINEGIEQLDKGQHESHQAVQKQIKDRFQF